MYDTPKRNLRHLFLLAIPFLVFLTAAPQALADEAAATTQPAANVVQAKYGSSQVGIHLSVGHRGYHGYRGYRGFYGYRPYYRYRYHSPFRYYRNYYPYGSRYHRYGYYGVPEYRPSWYGRLDFNVKPKKTTQVYIDGNYVGVAGKFDGWPEHLWLEKDSYEVILYNPGFETVVRNVEVLPGTLVAINEVMKPGESIPVEELTRAPIEAEKPRETAPTLQRRELVPPGEVREQPSDTVDARQVPARIQLSIAPADASVYLDGRFLGVAGEIAEDKTGFLVDPGAHVLEVVRPGFESRELNFKAEPGGKHAFEVELESEPKKTGLSV